MSTIVLDISKYNPINDYAKAAKSVAGVIIRCGYRGMSNGKLTEDPLFATHVKNFQAAGAKIGVYFFTTAISEDEAAEEAVFTHSLIQKYNIQTSFPVFVDSEMASAKKTGRSDNLSKSRRTAYLDAYCKKIQLLGYTAGIYSSDAWYHSMVDFNVLKQYKIWCARYSSKPPQYISGYCGWQFTSNGSIPGIPARVDLSYWYESIGSSNNKANTNKNNPYIQPTTLLRQGSKGQGVYWLQYELKKLGYNIAIDGDFGPKTKAAVVEYQTSRGLEPDGDVGSITRNALINKLPAKVVPQKAIVIDTGVKVSLNNIPLYSNSLTNTPKRNITGEYYIWSKDIRNDKIRICKSPEDTSNVFKVVGWVNVSDI